MTGVDQTREELRAALEDAGAALQRAGQAFERLRALVSAPEAEPLERERRHRQGPEAPIWRHVSVLADHLKISDGAAWDLAFDRWAQWPFGKRARKVDITKFRDVLPDLGNFDKL